MGILAAIIGFSSAFNLRGPTCDECKTAVADLHAHLLGEESMAEQIAILIAAGCPTADDPAQCEADVAKYWPGIATATFGYFFTEKEPCGEMGLNVCKKDWTCDDCTGASHCWPVSCPMRLTFRRPSPSCRDLATVVMEENIWQPVRK